MSPQLFYVATLLVQANQQLLQNADILISYALWRQQTGQKHCSGDVEC